LALFHAPARDRLFALSLHDALPISVALARERDLVAVRRPRGLALEEEAFRRGRIALLLRQSPHVLPVSVRAEDRVVVVLRADERSEEHTSELQSPDHLVCRLLLEEK